MASFEPEDGNCWENIMPLDLPNQTCLFVTSKQEKTMGERNGEHMPEAVIAEEQRVK